MLLCQQSTVIDKTQHDESTGISSIFLTAAQVAAYVTSIDSLPTGKLMIIDCGSPLRHSERHIKDALLLNINDKLSRKRLATRGLKNFLDAKLLHRLEQSDLIVLYDDSTACPPSPCANASSTPKLSPAIKCIFDEVQRFDSTKTIYVLQSTFDEFYTQHPVCCHVNASNVESTDQPIASPTVDLDAFDMCEILPGMYLGNARDAQDRTALINNNIHAIVNISTNIPCFHAHDSLFDYLRLACEDSSRENIVQHFEAAFSYMRAQLAANKNVLVHCQGGISRSPSFVIGYLMSQHGQTFNEAYALVRAKRSIVNPNLNFIAQLTRYEQLLSATPRQ